MKDATLIKMWGMSLIAGLEAVNLAVFGVNGVVFGGVVAAIAGLAGYEVAKAKIGG